jgi:hypothetical protein
MTTGSGQLEKFGSTDDFHVSPTGSSAFASVEGEINNRIDAAYPEKDTGSTCIPPMFSARAGAAMVRVSTQGSARRTAVRPRIKKGSACRREATG